MAAQRIEAKGYRVELHAEGDRDYGRVPVLRFFKGEDAAFEIVLNDGLGADFLGYAEMFYRGYVEHNLGQPRDSQHYKRLVQRGRRGMGYSYP